MSILFMPSRRTLLPSRDAAVRRKSMRRSGHPSESMIPPTIPQLVARAADHPFLGEHLSMGTGDQRDSAIAHFDSVSLVSGYEPIFDISVHALAQSLSSAPESVDRFGDELGFQAVTQRLDDVPFDSFERVVDD